MRVGLAWLGGLATGIGLLAAVGVAWLGLGIATHVWVDGCPDVAPPLAPLLWRRIHVIGLAPSLVMMCTWMGWRVGRRVAGGPAFVNRPRDGDRGH